MYHHQSSNRSVARLHAGIPIGSVHKPSLNAYNSAVDEVQQSLKREESFVKAVIHPHRLQGDKFHSSSVVSRGLKKALTTPSGK